MKKIVFLLLPLAACASEPPAVPTPVPTVEYCGRTYSQVLYNKLEASGQLPACNEGNL